MALVLLANNSSSNKQGYYWIKGGGGSDWLNIQIQKKKEEIKNKCWVSYCSHWNCKLHNQKSN